jgi:hypothetical protein
VSPVRFSGRNVFQGVVVVIIDIGNWGWHFGKPVFKYTWTPSGSFWTASLLVYDD